jgi:hypothetical protein
VDESESESEDDGEDEQGEGAVGSLGCRRVICKTSQLTGYPIRETVEMEQLLGQIFGSAGSEDQQHVKENSEPHLLVN